MKQSWLNNTLSIATIFSFRMLGLFMLIPVFTLYANHLIGATPALLGIALGGYGLSQGLLQMPFGLLSDRFGRKPLLIFGLFLFACGSLLGALTHSIYGMIVARILQGTGAIGSVLIALLADLTPDQHRTKAMAIIGVTVGFSFSLAMIISPAMTHYWGLASIFYFTALLAILGLGIVYFIIPTPRKEPFHNDRKINLSQFKQVLQNTHLQRLNFGIFCQHLILTSTFFALPILLQHQLQLGHLSQQWHFYFPLTVGSFLAIVPVIVWAERKQKTKLVFLVSVILTLLSQLILAFTYQSWLSICISMFVYFMGFNVLEANLPSLVSKQANPESKGTAMGIYSSCQFLGIFVGGALAGIIYQATGSQGIFITNAIFSSIWLITVWFMQPNEYELTLAFSYDKNLLDESTITLKLHALPGVKQIRFASDESLIYLRIEKSLFRAKDVEEILGSS